MTPVRLEFAAPRSRVKHSTTESLRSLEVFCVPYVLSEWRGLSTIYDGARRNNEVKSKYSYACRVRGFEYQSK